MRGYKVLSVSALICGLAGCSQAPAKAEDAGTTSPQAQTSEEMSNFNFNLPGDEVSAQTSGDTGGFNFNLPDTGAQTGEGFNVPTPEYESDPLPTLPDTDRIVDPGEADEEALIRID